MWRQVGDHDNGYRPDEASLHNRVIANEWMSAALNAKHDHYQNVSREGAAHVDRKAVAPTLAEALEWLWKGTR